MIITGTEDVTDEAATLCSVEAREDWYERVVK